MAKKDFKEYADFIKQVGHGQLDNVEVTHNGYPLSCREAKFIDDFIANGDVAHALRESKLAYKSIAGKEYITDEITWRLDQLKKVTIADADEIMQYFTKVMRGEEKDQFGLDAPLAERTNAAKELARRVIDYRAELEQATVPEVKVTLNWEGM